VWSITSITNVLFRPVILYCLLSLSVIALYFFYVKFNTVSIIENLSPEKVLIMYLVLIISLIFHEIGHASAARYFKLEPKEIGFGFYYIFPVYFSNVTQVWMLSPKNRVIVNLGGIYFQLILNLVFIASIYLFKDDNFFEIISCVIKTNIIILLYSLLPFFRNDGYWIFSDIFNIHNLLKESDQLPIEVIKAVRNKDKSIIESKSIGLWVYTLSNWCFRIYIIINLICSSFAKSTLIINYLYFKEPQYTSIELIKLVSHNILIIVGIVMFSRYIYKLVTAKTSINEGY
jgi:putative peptide zinc metalloprotease protein